MREFLSWLRFGFSIRTFGAIFLTFLLMLCVWFPGVILATRFWVYMFGVPLPDFMTMLFPPGRLGAILMVLCFGAFSVYFIYARDTKWGQDDTPPADEEQ